MRRLFWLRRELRRLYREKGIKNKARGGLVFLQQETIFGAQGQKRVLRQGAVVQGAALIGPEGGLQQLGVVADEAHRLGEHILVVRQGLYIVPGGDTQGQDRLTAVQRGGERILRVAGQVDDGVPGDIDRQGEGQLLRGGGQLVRMLRGRRRDDRAAQRSCQGGDMRGGGAAAKAKGVKFGRPPKPLPHNFHEVHRAWRAKKMMLKQAAEACNMPVGTFYDKARKFENIA